MQTNPSTQQVDPGRVEWGMPALRRNADIPALAFGSGLTALGVLRSLHSSGITVYSVCPRADLAAKSRWYRPAPALPGGIPQPAHLAEYLTELPVQRAVLFPCADDWARAIASLPRHLRERFPASISSAPVVETMTDKWRFYAFVECVDIPRPKTLRVASMEELESLDEACCENKFLKPIDSQEFSRRNRVKAFQIEGKRHAVKIMKQLHGAAGQRFPILLQEYVPGPPTNSYIVDGFIDCNREIRALIARRRLSQYPPLFGNTAGMVTVPLLEVNGAIESLEKMWATVTYRGIFSAEFKFDIRDGLWKIIEVNARPWWFVEFVTRCGVDVCRMSYEDALGLPVESLTRYDVGRRCFYRQYDLAAKLRTDRGLRGVLRWIRASVGSEDIVYRWGDPWPGIHAAASAFRNYRRQRDSVDAPALPCPGPEQPD